MRFFEQGHIGLHGGFTTFAMIALRAGCHQIVPGVIAAQGARDDMINGKLSGALAAVLAGVVITPEDLCLGQLNRRARTFDHIGKTDDGWGLEENRNGFDVPPAVGDQGGFFGEDQADGAFCCANIEGFKVCV